MNFSATWLLSGLFISCLGLGIFRYGKVTAQFTPIFAGIAMLVYPYVIYSVPLLWLITAAICVLLYLMREKQ
ncbi:MAG TPA: amino acid transport protein [Phycisphaerae bacterium]|jgi:hypothetical protein|nr:amino acid transport protein [Phycisphaerae bacterium]